MFESSETEALSVCLQVRSVDIAENYVYRNGLKSRRVPISFLFYMIELDGRRILVDAGCDSMPSFAMEHFITPVALLNRHGISTESISDVIVTHAHHDHIGSVPHFGNATIHIQKDEAAAGAKYLNPENNFGIINSIIFI